MFPLQTHTKAHIHLQQPGIITRPTLPSSGIIKEISLNLIESGIEFRAGHGLFDQFLMSTVLLYPLEETLFYPQSLRHNIRHINKDHHIPQALNILQASTSLPNGNTTLATVSIFLFKAS